MTNEERKELLSRYLDGTGTNEEKILVENWYKEMTTQAADPEDVDFKDVEKAIAERIGIVQSQYKNYKRWAAAAAILVVIGTSVAFWATRQQRKNTSVETVAIKDMPPAGNRAVLTLSNGQQVILDTVNSGIIVQQSGVTIAKNAMGQLVYKVQSSRPSASLPGENRNGIAYNTITTPRGGQFEVILPDGSKVTLNAASSLRYPTRFASSERNVTLTGEAYFDVRSDLQKPFIVVSSEQQIKVLGTHFNVSCYLSEPIKTTLEEGKVEISKQNNTQKTTLKPGEQSIVTSEGIEVRQVNLKAAIAWRNGMFIFRSTSMKDVMKQFSRWYDVDVDYSVVPDQAFHGEIPRTLSLLKVLEIINAYSEYKYTLEGRRIVRK